MGKQGFQELMEKRVQNYQYLKEKLSQVASKHGEHVLNVEGNDISIGVSLKSIVTPGEKGEEEVITSVGAMLFRRNVTGSRVVSTKDVKTIDGFIFKGWGAHHPNYSTPYLTAAAALGMENKEIDYFAEKLDECLEYYNTNRKLAKLHVTTERNNNL